MDKPTVPCNRDDCRGNVNGLCIALSEEIKNCPFFKSRAQEVLEVGALTAFPHPDYEAFRRHSGTHPVSKAELARWLSELEEVCPTTDTKISKAVARFLLSSRVYVLRSEVKAKIVEYMAKHPAARGWGMSAEETADFILNEEVTDEQSNEDES